MATEKKAEDYSGMSFEAALARLEAITGLLESPSTSLDAALGNFQEGVALVKHCGALLDNAEKQIKILTRSPEGEVVEADFDGN